MSLANELRTLRKGLKDDIAQFESLRELNTDQSHIELDLEDLKVRLASLENFNNVQFNEMLDEEVDKAINIRVKQQVFDEVVDVIRQQIIDGDTELSVSIGNAVLGLDQLTTKVDAMNEYLEILQTTYTILDAEGNIVNFEL